MITQVRDFVAGLHFPERISRVMARPGVGGSVEMLVVHEYETHGEAIKAARVDFGAVEDRVPGAYFEFFYVKSEQFEAEDYVGFVDVLPRAVHGPAPDRPRLYTVEQALEAFPSVRTPEFSIDDLVVLVLAAQEPPVHGRIMLMKEAFLLYKEVLKDRASDPCFVKYRHGPHSFHIAELLNTLHADGILDRRGRRNSNSESFRLTQKGRKMAAGAMGRLSGKERGLVSEKRMGWDQLGVRGMLNYVYAKYPEYKEKSALKNRYKDVAWGNTPCRSAG